MTVSPTNGISLADGDGTYVNEVGDETITGSLTVTKDQNSDTTLNVDNGTNGTAARAEISVTANASSGGLYQLSSGYTSSGSMQADSTVLESASTASGGLILSAGGSNNMSLYNNGNLSMKVNAIGQVVSIAGPMTSRSAVAGISGAASDENSFELGEGYLNLSRNSTAEAQQIRFMKDGSLHSGIKTDTGGFRIFGSDGNTDLQIDTSGNALFAAGITAASLPSGATAAAAGAGAGELWVTASHATLPDGVVMRG